MLAKIPNKSLMLLLILGCLANGAVAQQPELVNPQNDKPWDTKKLLRIIRAETSGGV